MLKRHVIGVGVISLAIGVLAAGPAEAAGHTFSGTITGPDVTLSTIKVEAINVRNGNTVSSATPAANTGVFQVKNIKSAYRIRFSAKVDGQTRTWYWVNNTSFHGSSKMADGTQINGSLASPFEIKFGTIHGTVAPESSTTGTLTPRISVASAVSGTSNTAAISKAARFHVVDQKANDLTYKVAFLPYRTDYKVHFADVAKNYQNDWYNAAILGGVEYPSSATALTINAANSQKVVDFTYKRAYRITGSVKGDADGGGYVTEQHRDGSWISRATSPTHSVEVLRSNGSVFASANVDGLGNYVVPGLRRGESYTVRFGGRNGKSRFYAEYYCENDSVSHTSGERCDGGLANTPSGYVGKLYANVSASYRSILKVDSNTPTTVALDDVTLDIGRKISGKVTFATGKRKARRSVAVRAYNDQGWASRWSYSDSKGNYTIGGLAPGSYKIEANFDGFKKKEKKRRYYNGKKGGATSSGKAKWVNVTNGNVKIPNLYSDS